MDSLHNARDIAGEWDELKAQGRPRPIDPRRNRRLLNTGMILEAVARIGPEAAMDFYRKLAAQPDRDAREEAAPRLGEVPTAKAQNEPILRNLLADKDQKVHHGGGGEPAGAGRERRAQADPRLAAIARAMAAQARSSGTWRR